MTAVRSRPADTLEEFVDRLARADALDGLAESVAQLVHRATRGQRKDLLTGTWLGHPLHPLLTDIPIGSFTSASILDLVGGKRGRRAADRLVTVGLLSALPTAAAGAADWSDTEGERRRIGLVHAVCNAVGLMLYFASWRARRDERRWAGVVLGLAGMTVMSAGGYLGGHLTFARGVGVNNAFDQELPSEWTTVARDEDLIEGKPIASRAGAADVLVYRAGPTVRAIGARCTHAGGPLEEGTIDEYAGTVQCPWHGSVFSLDSGAALHGPASVAEPAYDVRVHEGLIQVRRPG